ncbi:hypothetical protein NC653_012673 [Populus alba x Populus x berolinensis]|uniref:Pentatricopeptide repeat-containing protein n=1 Tax=Populus alba x Populus x berolinensis TaxID=444605 RepID=A0AAD6W2J2_9ROSI|nr:hypothetical protein NC653_012673 [Populus alba x Populus x berolinensis]
MQGFASYETPKTSTTFSSSSSSTSNGDSKLTTKKHTIFLFCPLLPSNSQQHKTMLKLLSSTSRQIQTHLTSPCLRVATESQPSSFVNSLSSLTGLAQRNHKSLSFYQRAFFFSGSSSGDGGGFAEVMVRSGASETEAEVGSADASDSSAIVPTNPRPEDYLTVYKCLKLTLELVKKEIEISKIQGRFLQGTIFPGNKQGKRQFSALSLDESLTPTITNIISNQHWSKLKVHLQNTDPNTLLQQLLNSGADPELILRYFTWSQKEFKLSHSLELTFRILNSLALTKKYSKIRSFLDKFVKYEKDYSVSAIFHAISMSGDSFCVNSILADMLVLAYVRNLKILRGFEAFKRAGDYGFKLSLISCNPLLSGLVKESENGDMEFVYREMIKRKIELNVISFNIVVNGLCKVGKLNRAGDVIEDMKVRGVSPNVITYNTLIDGYCKMGRIGKMYKADAILKEMVAKGICPNEVTYNILIDGFCKDENVSGAMRVFGEMQRQSLRPNVVTYNTLINGLCSDGKVDEAVALRDQMVSSDLEPNVVTHNVLINGFCKNKTVNEAINLFNDMEKQGVDPNAMTYTTLIDAYCKDGRMEDAFALYNMMIDRGIFPEVSTFNCLIAGLCSKGDVKAARNLMNEMVSKKLSADVVTYNILIDSLCQKGESRKAVKILDEMFEKGLNPSHVTYNTLMDGYCREGNLRAALIVRTRMERKGKQANVVTYNVLIKGFCLKGRLEDANGLLNEMLERGLVPNRTTYEIIKEEMMEKGFVPDIEGHVYNVSGTNLKLMQMESMHFGYRKPDLHTVLLTSLSAPVYTWPVAGVCHP